MSRSLQAVLRNAYRIDQENREVKRFKRVVRDIIVALAKYPGEPGHACYADCPCQKEKQCLKS